MFGTIPYLAITRATRLHLMAVFRITDLELDPLQMSRQVLAALSN
jgi:hypothetical protein